MQKISEETLTLLNELRFVYGVQFFEKPPVWRMEQPRRITKNDAHSIQARIVAKSYPRYRGNAT